MSKRHQSSRRKSYGRRQHELAERRPHDLAPDGTETAVDDSGPAGLAERFAFLDPRASRMLFAMGD